MHFGLEGFAGIILYLTFIAACGLSIFWRPIAGIYYLLPLIPLQTVRYRMAEYPLGGSVVGVVLVAVAIGIMRSRRSILPRTPWTGFLLIYIPFTFLSLCYGSIYLGWSLPFPGTPRFGVWQDYMMMPALLLIIAALQPTTREIKHMIIIMCVATFVLDRDFWGVVSGRDFSSFSEDLRDAGNMGYAGINGLGAFEAQVATLLIALAAFEKKFWPRMAYYALALFSGVCLMYSLSRAGYIAIIAGFFFIGLVKQRKLLVALTVFALTWTALVPAAVQQRVMMSYDQKNGGLDHSAETRLVLWNDAMELVKSSPIIGTGYNTYAYMHRQQRVDGGTGYYEDTHNIYLKILVEMGALGLLLFVVLLLKSFLVGLKLFRRARDPFLASVGLGLAGWVLCSAIGNAFGDRWTFLQVNGYMWVLAALVSQGLVIEEKAAEEELIEKTDATDPSKTSPQPSLA